MGGCRPGHRFHAAMTQQRQAGRKRGPATVKGQQEFYSGIVFVVIGAAFIVVGWGLPKGTAMNMGPGYIPFASALILVAIGIACSARSLFRAGEQVEPVVWRPVLLIPLAVVAFGLTSERLGLVVAILLTVGICRLAIPGARLTHTLALGFGLATLCVLLFIYGFGTPVPVWPRFR